MTLILYLQTARKLAISEVDLERQEAAAELAEGYVLIIKLINLITAVLKWRKIYLLIFSLELIINFVQIKYCTVYRTCIVRVHVL